MLFLFNIFLSKYNSSYKIKGLIYVYKFPKATLFTYAEKKRPYRTLTSVGLINYLNIFDHACVDKNSSFTHFLATGKYVYSNIKVMLLR